MHHQQKKRNFCISRRQLKVIKDWTFFIWLTTMKPFYARFLVLIRTWTKLTSLDFCGQRPSKFTFFLRSFSKDKLHEVLRRELKFPFVQNSNIPTKLKNFRQTLNRLYELRLFLKKSALTSLDARLKSSVSLRNVGLSRKTWKTISCLSSSLVFHPARDDPARRTQRHGVCLQGKYTWYDKTFYR